MPILGAQLDLDRCPHCNVDRPNLGKVAEFRTTDYQERNPRWWRVYQCSRCGGAVTATSTDRDQSVLKIFPNVLDIDDAMPERTKEYLKQATNSLHSPAGAVMLAASAVDAMLREKQYKEGSLYARIDKAAGDHIITGDMAKWAHEVRLDANDQRHADETVALPTPEDARRAVDFAIALGQFIFVFPARVQRGITESTKPKA